MARAGRQAPVSNFTLIRHPALVSNNNRCKIILKPARNSVGGDDRLQRSRLFIAIVITQIFARNKNRVSLAA
jgi:hypothetical protein